MRVFLVVISLLVFGLSSITVMNASDAIANTQGHRKVRATDLREMPEESGKLYSAIKMQEKLFRVLVYQSISKKH